MNIFEEYLRDWDFSEVWRPVVERLNERTATWPEGLPEPDEFTIYEACGTADPATGKITPGDGLLIWVDFQDGGKVGQTLAAQVDRRGLRCGPVEPSRPDDSANDPNLTWLTRPIDHRGLAGLADDLLEWFALETRRWQDWLGIRDAQGRRE